MSYIIEQKIKGRTYLYKVEAYWDKEKKQSRQKRTYIGPKKSKNKKPVQSIKANIVHKNYGNVFLLNKLAERTGLKGILEKCFPSQYKELLALAFYEISEASPLYLFPYWLEENYLPNVKKMDSSSISKFCDELGRNQQAQLAFQEEWISYLQPVEALYYDIPSTSSYSTNINFVEWGYNRDHENLAQINLGVVFSNNRSLPLFYKLYPGSIVDVKTLLNCVKYLKGMGLEDFLFVLDRGFFSINNIDTISQEPLKINFIQPLPFSLKKTKELIKAHRRELYDVKTNFVFNDELLSHVKSQITIHERTYTVHIYLNQKAELEQRQLFMKKLIEIEEKIIKKKKFDTQKEALTFKENNIPKAYHDYFKYTRHSGMIERHTQRIKEKISRFGFFILATDSDNFSKEDILIKYRNKDRVEKTFDLLKNEMDGARLRAHSQYNTDARLFIKFLGLIIQSEIVKHMRKNDLFKTYSIKQMLSELKKVKYARINDETIISEISKRNRKIFEAFNIEEKEIHCY
ncbi:MAG: IS1634 family transposase [Thiohalospira sp.]